MSGAGKAKRGPRELKARRVSAAKTATGGPRESTVSERRGFRARRARGARTVQTGSAVALADLVFLAQPATETPWPAG